MTIGTSPKAETPPAPALEILRAVRAEDRAQLLEPEVLRLLETLGGPAPPAHLFLPAGVTPDAVALAALPGERLVLKLVSPDVVHKTEAGAVAFVRKDEAAVQDAIRTMNDRRPTGADVRGFLLSEFVEGDGPASFGELLVGVRATREFGPVVAAGLGGTDTEFLAERLRPGRAVAKAAALVTDPERFLELFRRTTSYEALSGNTRGGVPCVSDDALLDGFRAFFRIARTLCVPSPGGDPELVELEVNPFRIRDGRLVALDGRARLGTAVRPSPDRPVEAIRRLLLPQSIAVLGVSATSRNVGRIILGNLLESGFPRDRLRVVKDGVEEVDGVTCVPALSALEESLDLLVIAAGGAQLPDLVREAASGGRVRSAIVVAGGVGETEGSGDLAEDVKAALAESRRRPDGGMVLLGPNSLGVISRPGGYDTLFIPSERLDKRRHAPPRPVALLSQSGAFIITRMSNLEFLDPAFAVSLGNQLDVTSSDLVAALADRDDVHTIGIYLEGLNDLDGLALARRVESVVRAGRRVVFYKAGRSEAGRSAAAGHTASIAGDAEVCRATLEQAGALVTDTFREFEQLLELSASLHGKTVTGSRIGVVTNAGYEAVGMADAVRGERYACSLPPLADDTAARLRGILARHRLDALVGARNPLDLTPMAGEDAYLEAVQLLLEAEELDAVIVGVVPLTAALATGPDEVGQAHSLARRLPPLLHAAHRPSAVVIDSGPLYLPLVRALRLEGIAVFSSADQAMRSMGRYLGHAAR